MSQQQQLSQSHENQAKHNETLLSENCFPDPCVASTNLSYADWNVTILFYTALHYVQAYLWKNVHLGYRTRFINHTDRNNYLAILSMRDPKIASILVDYVGLFNASCIARYTPLSYYTISKTDICDYAKFALQKLPQTLR
jgi:hypothetical protein